MLSTFLFLSTFLVTAWATCDCTLPHIKCAQDPRKLDCPGGLVPNNKNCPCCWRCAQQEGQPCDVESPAHAFSLFKAFRYCGEGLECTNGRYDGTGARVGQCSSGQAVKCPFGKVYQKNCMNCTCDGNGREVCHLDEARKEACPVNPLPCRDGSQRRFSIETCCLACPDDSRSSEPFVGVVRQSESPVIVTEGNHLFFFVDVKGEFSNPALLHNNKKPTNGVRLTLKQFEAAFSQSDSTVESYTRFTVTGRNAQIETHSGEYTIQITNFENQLLDLVTLTVEVKRREIVRKCDFETDMCQLQSFSKDKLAWIRHCGNTSTPNTGPSSGNEGSKCYVYVDSLRDASGHIASLCSGFISPGQFCRLSFAYHMHGEDLGNLKVAQVKANGKSKVVWRHNGLKHSENEWKLADAELNLPVESKICFVARMKGKRGSKTSTYEGDIAVDGIKFLECSKHPNLPRTENE